MEHQAIMKSLLCHLVKNGFSEIRADEDGYCKPATICWRDSVERHIPDVTCTKANRKYLFEVETDESVDSEHTLSQLRLFSAFSEEHGYALCVVVPKKVEHNAFEMKNRLRIPAEIWTVA